MLVGAINADFVILIKERNQHKLFDSFLFCRLKCFIYCAPELMLLISLNSFWLFMEFISFYVSVSNGSNVYSFSKDFFFIEGKLLHFTLFPSKSVTLFLFQTKKCFCCSFLSLFIIFQSVKVFLCPPKVHRAHSEHSYAVVLSQTVISRVAAHTSFILLVLPSDPGAQLWLKFLCLIS